MNSATPVIDRPNPHDASQPSTDAVSHIAAPFAEAANDDDFYRNPLWMVVLAFACLFALLACLVASG